MFRIKATLCGALFGAIAGLAAQTPAPQPATSSQTTSPSPSISDRQMENAQKMQAAVDLQKAAAQTQTSPVEQNSFFSVGWSGPAMLPPPVYDCPPMQESETDPLIRASAARYQLNPALIKAMIQQESGFKACAVSDRGAIGLMQIMPETAELLKTRDPFDPEQNIEAGANYLKQMLARFKGDLRLALAAYNAGPEKVDGPAPAVPDIPETLDYVDSITNALHGEPAEMPTKPNPKATP